MPDFELQKWFEFDESDLAANRAGKLSRKQEQKIDESEASGNRSIRKFVTALVIFGIFLNIILVAAEIGGSPTPTNITLQYSRDPIGMLSAFCIPWAILGILIAGAVWLSSIKLDYSVQKAEGRVNFVKVEKRETHKTAGGTTSFRDVEQYELRVGKTAFEDVDEELLNLIEEGDIYAFYYTKDGMQILSCEFIAKGK